jgi:hypothetical protein
MLVLLSAQTNDYGMVRTFRPKGKGSVGILYRLVGVETGGVDALFCVPVVAVGGHSALAVGVS